MYAIVDVHTVMDSGISNCLKREIRDNEIGCDSNVDFNQTKLH